jgi:hypothetical protein
VTSVSLAHFSLFWGLRRTRFTRANVPESAREMGDARHSGRHDGTPRALRTRDWPGSFRRPAARPTGRSAR